MSERRPTRKMLDHAKALAKKAGKTLPWAGWYENHLYEITTGDFSGEHAPVGDGRSCPPSYDEVMMFIQQTKKELAADPLEPIILEGKPSAHSSLGFKIELLDERENVTQSSEPFYTMESGEAKLKQFVGSLNDTPTFAKGIHGARLTEVCVSTRPVMALFRSVPKGDNHENPQA